MDKKHKRGNRSKEQPHNLYSIASSKIPQFNLNAKWLNKSIKATPENLDTIRDPELRDLCMTKRRFPGIGKPKL